VEYPIGHKKCREEGIPKLIKKFKLNLTRKFNEQECKHIINVSLNQDILDSISVDEYINLY